MTELHHKLVDVQKTMTSYEQYESTVNEASTDLESKKAHAKKQNLKDLGQFAKEIGLKKNLELAEIKDINYIKPN